jgi:phage-related protein
MTDDVNAKELVFVASSRKQLQGCPPAVRRSFGVGLFAVQCGETPPDAKPLRGFGGASVLELIEDHDRSSYRAVYTVRFATVVYVLHVFQKKSKSGIETPKQEIELIRQRLKTAERLYAERTKEV